MKHLASGTLIVLSAAAGLGLASSASAQEVTNYVPTGEIARDGTLEGGWDGTLSLSATFNVVSNSSVVGQPEGESFLGGGAVRGGLDYVYGAHEWRNTLLLQQSWAKTEAIDEWLKNNDVLEIESIYHYYFVDWAGAFGRLNLQTAIFDAEQVTAEPTTYIGPDGTAQAVDRLALADAFEPLTINESIGAFLAPVRSSALNVRIRLGAGGRHTLADDVIVLAPDANADGSVPFTVLSDVHQAGVEMFGGVDGVIMDKRLTYRAGVSVLLPFLNNDPLERGVGDLTRIGASAGLSTSVFEWLSLNYEFKAINDPQLLDEWQIQNSLLLSFNYTLIERDRTPAPVDPMAEKLAAAEARAAAAEERAQKAEAAAAEKAAAAAEAEKAAAEEKQKATTAEEKLEAAGEAAPADGSKTKAEDGAAAPE